MALHTIWNIPHDSKSNGVESAFLFRVRFYNLDTFASRAGRIINNEVGCLMKSALLNFVVALLLVLPGLAQMRSTISAGPIRSAGPFNGGRPHPPGIYFRHGFRRHFGGNGFGTVVYPYGLYDGFYDDGYPDVVEQPAPPVVIVREAPAASAPAPPVALAQAEPKMIDVPEAVAPSANLTRTPAAVFILSDGRRLESQNYTITDSVLTVKEPHRPAVQVPLSQLNIDATLAENHQRGLDLRLPESRSEIVIGF
jgi:hypothetical protein